MHSLWSLTYASESEWLDYEYAHDLNYYYGFDIYSAFRTDSQ